MDDATLGVFLKSWLPMIVLIIVWWFIVRKVKAANNKPLVEVATRIADSLERLEKHFTQKTGGTP
jgi:hypothetical protein